MELPFAGLHQLCGPLLNHLQQLPPPQRDALATAFGLSSGSQPDRFLICLAVLSLFSEAAEELPLLGLIDDVQWLDRSSTLVLAFVARRLGADSVGLVFAVRGELELDGLARLPDSAAPGPVGQGRTSSCSPRSSARRLMSGCEGGSFEARENPLALLELPRELSPASLAGGFGLPGELPLESRIEASFQRRVQQLPADTQRLLLLAAAEPTGEPALLWRSAAELGITAEAAAPAVGEGMLELGARIAFRHPLLRSAIYQAAPGDDQRAAHRALAIATELMSTPIAGPGISLMPRSGPTRRSPTNSSGRPRGRRLAADWPLPPRSSSGPPR